jgi:hypothetical protein
LTKRLLDYDPSTGITEYFHYDHTTDTSYVETIQDVEPILDVNKAEANDPEITKRGIKNGLWRFASVPLWVQMKWLNEYGLKNWPMLPENGDLLFRLLNSPDWKYLKCTEKIHIARG